MKAYLILPLVILAVAVSAQEKIKARVSASYVKVMNKESFINLTAKYKSEGRFEPASELHFIIFQKIQDSLQLLGKVKTGSSGSIKFILDKSQISETLKSGDLSFVIKIDNDPKFQDAETEINIFEANLSASLKTVDSVNQISAMLTDASGKPLKGQSLKVQLQRMYAPLQVGTSGYETDENGSIAVPIVDRMPGIDGHLTYEVVLEESDLYGTVKSIVPTNIGVPIKDQSTFDKRTMWSPPSKTPYYLLMLPNIIILIVWTFILILIINLFRISKTKTKSI